MTATLDVPPTSTATVTLTIARQALRTALARLAGAVGSGAKALPVAQHVKFEVAPGQLTLTATDFEAFVRLTVPCDATGTVVALLPAKRLAEIVGNLPPVGAVTLALSGTRAVLTAGRARFELSGMAPAEFPLTPLVVAGPRLTVNAAAFLDAMERAAPHASDSTARPSINTVRLEPAASELVVVATSGHTLARLVVPATLTADAAGAVPEACSLFRMSAPVLARLFSGLPDAAELTLGTDGARFLVESADAIASVRVVDLDYPLYQPLIDVARTARTLVCDRLLLRAAIQRVALVTDDARRVELTFADEIGVRAADAKNGTGADVVPLEATDSSGTSRTLAVNATQALAVLDTLTTSNVEISLGAPEVTALFRPVADDDKDPAIRTIVLIQPLRSI